MRLSTRLLLPLLATVVVVMSLYSARSLRGRQNLLEAESRRATHAYATALGLALEGAFRSPHLEGVQEIVDRISKEPEIYGVLVYGTRGEVLFASDLLHDAPSPAPRIRTVLSSGSRGSFERVVGDQRVYSVIGPLQGSSGSVVGAFEVAQPLSFVQAEQRETQQRFLLSTLTLLIAMTGVILWLVRRVIARPLSELVRAVQAVGRGELGHRIRVEPQAGELTELAVEFNRMADRLEAARVDLLRESEERIALEQRLRQTEKMAAVGSLAAGLAHEIAAPLNVVAGRADMLARREMEPEVRARNLRIIVDQIGRITVIVRNLLDFARRREPRLRRHDLADVLDSVLELLDGEFTRAGIEVRREVQAPLWVRGDPDLLHQVFINLLLNAVHALEQVEDDRVIHLRAALSSTEGEGVESVHVEIRDSGRGIPPESLGQIFEPFFTTKSGGEGTGLGLAVARGIIEEHGGSISAENWEHGAVFRLTVRAALVTEAAGA